MLVALVAVPAAAQYGPPAEPCPEGAAQAWLQGARVRAALFTNGNLFFGNKTVNGDGYLVPRGQTGPDGAPTSAVFAADLWVGGLVGGEVRTSASRYSSFPFRPGRTGPDHAVPDSAACAAADRIWTVSRADVEAYLAGGAPTADLLEWPAHLGAPVLDGDGDPTNYALAAGDQPAVRGDVTAFWAMTDTPADRRYPGPPVGVDVTVEAFATYAAALTTETVYRVTVTNRNGVPLDSAYVGLFADWDLGDSGDDYVGTDTTARMLFVYNAFETDRVYGVPPAFGAVLAEGPVGLPNGRDDDGDGETDEEGERLGLTHVPAIWKVQTVGLPDAPQQYYYRLQGLFNDGSKIREGGEGYQLRPSGPITRFFLPGDPVTGQFWSEMNIDGNGSNNGTGERWGMVPAGPFRLAPDSSATVTFALVFAQGADRFDSVRRLRRKARGILQAVDQGAFDPVRLAVPDVPVPLSVRRPYPNPFADAAAVEVRESGAPGGAAVAVTVYDALGRPVAGPEAVAATPSGRLEVGRGLAPGVYVVRVSGPGFDEAFVITKIR